MKYKLLLAEYLVYCPHCWQVFIKSLKNVDTTKEEDSGDYTVSYIDECLEPYHAKYIDLGENQTNYVIFETEADAIMFKLKYGGHG